MNLEIDQQIKFAEQFVKLIADAPQKFKEKWDGEIKFMSPGGAKLVPYFNSNLINMLPDAHRTRFEILRKKYYAKTL